MAEVYRVIADRKPDVYNDHLLGLLKFNDKLALRAVERFELGLSSETIEVTADDNTLLMLDFGESLFAVVDGTFNVNAGVVMY